MKRFLIVFRSLPTIIHCLWYIATRYPFRAKKSRLKRYTEFARIVRKENEHLHVDLHVTGKENLPCEQSYMITPNHQSIFDTLVMFSIFDEPITYVAKSQLSHVPGARKIVPYLDGYFIERDNLRQELKVMKNVQASLQKDNLKWIIFPEGTRTRKTDTWEMNPFKAGTFKFPMQIGNDIVPCAIYGTYSLFDKNVKKKRYDVYVHFFAPLTKNDYKDLSTQELSAKVQEMIQAKVYEFVRDSQK